MTTIKIPETTLHVLDQPVSLQHAIYVADERGFYKATIRVDQGWYAGVSDDPLWDGLAERLVDDYDPYDLSHRIVAADAEEDVIYIEVEVGIAEYLRSAPHVIGKLNLDIPEGFPL